MAELLYIKVTAKEAGTSIQSWFKQHYPHISKGLVQKHLRKGFIRVNDKKALPSQELDTGHVVRIHPVVLDEAGTKKSPAEKKRVVRKFNQNEREALEKAVIYKDNEILVLNKPAGLAVQGGSGIRTSLDDMLDLLKFDYEERPKLVHRLDKDTSGVLLLARTSAAAARLTQYFREKTVQKIYWALVVGTPSYEEGKIDVPLEKVTGEDAKEKVKGTEKGQRALSYYEVIDKAGKVSWLALMPVTGRTHQLRVHCLALGTPIVGDGKYGGRDAFIEGVEDTLHLHARQIILPDYQGKKLDITAPLPEHMANSWEMFGFSTKTKQGKFTGGKY